MRRMVVVAVMSALLSVFGVVAARAEFGFSTAFGLPHFYFSWKLPCDSNPGRWLGAWARGGVTRAPTDRAAQPQAARGVPAPPQH